MRTELPVIPPLDLSLAPFAATAMFLGYFAAGRSFIEWMETRPVHEKMYWLIVLVSLIITIGLCTTLQPDVIFDKVYFGEYGGLSVFPYFVDATATMIVLFFLGAWVLRCGTVTRLLSTVERRTLAIICFHPFIVKMLIAPFYTLSSSSLFPDLPMLTVAVAGLLTLIIITLAGEYLFPALVTKIRGTRR